MKKMLNKLFRKTNIKWYALLLIIIIVLIFFGMTRNNDIVVIRNHDMYQYFNGFRVDYKGRIQINKNEDEITKISFDGNSTELDSTPLFYADSFKILFPKNMSVVYPLQGKQYKINFYSELYKDSDEVVVKDKKNEKRLFDAIIYDGADLYVLTEDSTVTVGANTYKLNALSYVIANTFSKTVAIFDYKNQKYTELTGVLEEVLISNSKFRVNASLDLMYYDDSSKLLIKNIGKLTNLPVKD